MKSLQSVLFLQPHKHKHGIPAVCVFCLQSRKHKHGIPAVCVVSCSRTKTNMEHLQSVIFLAATQKQTNMEHLQSVIFLAAAQTQAWNTCRPAVFFCDFSCSRANTSMEYLQACSLFLFLQPRKHKHGIPAVCVFSCSHANTNMKYLQSVFFLAAAQTQAWNTCSLRSFLADTQITSMEYLRFVFFLQPHKHKRRLHEIHEVWVVLENETQANYRKQMGTPAVCLVSM